MKCGFLFGAGAEIGYGLPSGGLFALDIFRHDTAESKQDFKNMRDNVELTTAYANQWLPSDFRTKNISSFGKSVFQNIIRDTVEHNRDAIIAKLNDFDEIAKREAGKLRDSFGIDITSIIEKALQRDIDNAMMGQQVAFIDEFKDGNKLFDNHYFSAFLLIYKERKDIIEGQIVEFRKILLSVLQLQVGALSEELSRRINDSLFSHKDDEIDIFDDIGEIIQLNYSSSGLSGMEYLLEQREADIDTEGGKILRFAQRIIEAIYASVLDYKSLIDANWHYLYSPKSDWAKFCKISIFLLTVRSYISEKVAQANISGNQNGYYHMLKTAIDNQDYDTSIIATTNYNPFIENVIGREISYLNGSTEIWYDPYLNRIGKKENLDTGEHHFLVPLMFTQSGTKPMTAIDMSVRYVDTYNKWKCSDAVIVVGFGFGADDEHINGILRTLVDIDAKKLIVVTLGRGADADTVSKDIARKLKVNKRTSIKVIQVNHNGYTLDSNIAWTQAIKDM